MAELPRNVELSLLLARYGALLTDKQRRALALHYDEDLSLAEIAEQCAVSRQNVYDLLTRGAQQLEKVEGQLGFARQSLFLAEQLRQARHLLDTLPPVHNREKTITDIAALLDGAIAQLEGEDDGL